MSKRTVEITVGFFVIAAFAALIVLALRVSGLSDVYSSGEGYTFYANFDNVGGLKARARVSIAGVPVGRVLDIKFNEEDYSARVKLFVRSDVDQIPDDTPASILTAGLLGDNYIGLNPESGWSKTYLGEGSNIPRENTHSALVLEELISKFVSSKASGQ
jgi:phospholipid/cholesterol/gamma-HCH transport system substrate-binding protein